VETFPTKKFRAECRFKVSQFDMLQEFRAKLALEGKDPEAIAREVAMA
jgi:hypothetical protein